MKRNFSEASREAILRAVDQIDNANYGNLTEWNRDGWNNYSDLGYLFNIGAYVDSVNVYHRSVLENLDVSRTNIKRIFDEVNEIDEMYAREVENIRDIVNEYRSHIKEMNSILAQEKKNVKATDFVDIASRFVKKSLEQQAIFIRKQILKKIGGSIVVDYELLKKWFKKRADELDDKLKEALIDVVDGAVCAREAIYDKWWKNDEDGRAGISIFETIIEVSEDEASFASSLMKWTVGNSALSILGLEYSKKLDGIFKSESYTEYLAKYTTKYSTQYFGKSNEYDNVEVSTEIGFKKAKEAAKDFKDRQEEKFKKEGDLKKKEYKKYFDKNGKEINEKDAGFAKETLTIFEVDKTEGVSKSLYEGTLNIGDNGEINATIGNAEAHSSIKGGLYVVDSSGKEKFSPSIKAEVGASVTALEVGWDQQWLGDENLGVNSNITVTAGKAGVKGEAVGQIWGDDGELNVQVSGKVEAEAIAGKVEGSVGLNVLGGEVAVKGSLNYGIGAHAEVGYKDGVFKVDVGATLGIGASVGFEVDIGGTIEKVGGAIVDTASAAWEGVQDKWDDFKKGWNDFWSW